MHSSNPVQNLILRQLALTSLYDLNNRNFEGPYVHTYIIISKHVTFSKTNEDVIFLSYILIIEAIILELLYI